MYSGDIELNKLCIRNLSSFHYDIKLMVVKEFSIQVSRSSVRDIAVKIGSIDKAKNLV